MNLIFKILTLTLVQFVFIQANVLNPAEFLHPECGKGTDSPTDRIYGGANAKKGNWGWHVMLRKKVNPRGFCGGSLLNDRWIVTAAHCVYGQANPLLYVIDAGVYNRTSPDPWAKLNLDISKIIVNSKFSWDTIQDDIALIKLANPIPIDTINYTITPVCLALDEEYYTAGRKSYSTGFGVKNVQNQNSDVLREIAVPLTSDQECVSYNLQYDYQIDPTTQICAGSIGGNRTASENDSGGPMVVRGSDNRWRLNGIISWGFGGKGNIGIYTKVSAFKNWIFQNILLN